MTRRMYDAAYPPSSPPRTDAVAFYIGGDTPHVWTASEIARQPARYRLPIYVRSNPSGVVARAMSRLRTHPVTRRPAAVVAKAYARLRAGYYAVTAAPDAAAAIAWLRAHHAPHGSVVALDLETAINAAYVRTFDADLVAVGYKVLAYGSVGTVFSNPRTSGGYWVANPTGSAHMHSGAVATQWAFDTQLGHPWDLSDVADSVPLWDTHAPTPTPTPQPDEEIDMAQRDLLAGLTEETGLGMPPKTGGYGFVEFYCDNSFTKTLANGTVIKAWAPVDLRVVIEKSDGTWQHVEPFTVGRAAKDTKQNRWRIPVVDKNSVYVSVVRLSGTGDEKIQVAAY